MHLEPSLRKAKPQPWRVLGTLLTASHSPARGGSSFQQGIRESLPDLKPHGEREGTTEHGQVGKELSRNQVLLDLAPGALASGKQASEPRGAQHNERLPSPAAGAQEEGFCGPPRSEGSGASRGGASLLVLFTQASPSSAGYEEETQSAKTRKEQASSCFSFLENSVLG